MKQWHLVPKLMKPNKALLKIPYHYSKKGDGEIKNYLNSIN